MGAGPHSKNLPRQVLPDSRPWCTWIAHLRYRVFEGEAIRIERMTPSFTVGNPHKDLNFALFDRCGDLREFVARSNILATADVSCKPVQQRSHHACRASPIR